ncbi:hypothetical protein PMAYCL1PPCAC_10622, partial [Pristionchus mayeri]
MRMYSSCAFNRHDPCGNLCSPNSKCQFLDTGGTDDQGSLTRTAACVCDAGFEGEFCDRQQASDCSGQPCLNGSECVDQTNPSGFICICATGYTGDICDVPLGLCTETSCENGGTCYNLDPLSIFCLCKEGYAGQRCERMINFGCFNKGTARRDGSCACTTPWEGTFCTLLKNPVPVEVCGCANGGTCVYDVTNEIEQTSCKCPDNYVGEKSECEIQSVSPCDGYCYNGGICRIVNGTPVCQCTLRFSRKQCNTGNIDKSYNVKLSPSTQDLSCVLKDLTPVFSVCLWIRATPKDASQNSDMPIFEIDFGG